MADFAVLKHPTQDGIHIAYRDYPAPYDGAPTALLMHGLTRNSRDFADLAAALNATHRVVVPEQRGRGQSDWDDNPERYAIPNYVADMFSLLAGQQLNKVAVVGTSMGGLMAMVMHAMNPSIFSHVVMNDVGPVVDPVGIERIKGYVGKARSYDTWDDAIAHNQAINGVAFPELTDADWESFTRQLFIEVDGVITLDYDPAISAALNQDEASAVPPDLWPVFELLASVPLLLIRGAISDLLSTETVDEMKRRHPSMEYLEVASVGHAPMLRAPDVIKTIGDFLGS